jgi:perosamine synthetase
VHFAGLPVDMAALPERPRVLVEDAAHALGASTPDGPVGNCARSDMCTFSFHPVKAITTGEGGAVTTNSSALADALRAFRNHGMVRRPELGGWYYDVAGPGYNYRITDMQAALGVSQLAKLERFVARRNELASRYHELLAALPIDLPPVAPPGSRHAYHLFAVRVPERRAVYDAMHAAGIGVQVHYVPIYKHSLFADVGRSGSDFPETERAYAGLLSLPLYPGLTEREQDRVVEVLSQCIG